MSSRGGGSYILSDPRPGLTLSEAVMRSVTQAKRWHPMKPPDAIKDYPEVKCFQRVVVDGVLSVFITREEGLWHLSISHGVPNASMYLTPGRYPTWDEIADARYLFCPSDINMAMFLPPKNEYVNLHPTTFHLYEVTVRKT